MRWNCSILKTKLESCKDVQVPSQLSDFKQVLFVLKFHKLYNLKKVRAAQETVTVAGIAKPLTNYKKDMRRIVAERTHSTCDLFFCIFIMESNLLKAEKMFSWLLNIRKKILLFLKGDFQESSVGEAGEKSLNWVVESH